MLFALFVIPLAIPLNVSGAVNISPDSGSTMLGIPTQFTVTGLNSAITYSVEVDDSEEETGLTPSSDGILLFSVTFSSEGNHKVEVLNSSSIVVASASIYCQDIVLLITTLLGAILGIVIVVKIFDKVEDMF